MKFLGFRRPDGKVGIRNHVLVLATVGCAAEAARQTADGIYGAVSFINQNGAAANPRATCAGRRTCWWAWQPIPTSTAL